jgi:2-keto-4-pentenoate hydratase/2-oxohepta-3-ene-1,7-dioic acid hydratase in catechol pathway
MKLVSYIQSGQQRLGAMIDDLVVDLNRGYAAARRAEHSASQAQALADAQLPSHLVRFLEGGTEAVAAARHAVTYVAELDAADARRELLTTPLADVRLLPAVPRPPKIVCVARNYGAHAQEAGREVSPIPILFPRFANTLVAHGDPVVRPSVSDELDWEGELAVVIGRGGRHVTPEAALGHVAGYSIFNDVTVRDYQFRVAQYTAGKNFSASGPLGPYLVLADEIADPHDLEIVTTVSGEEMQRASTRDMLFDIPTLIAHISEFVELEPGDVIPTGTPAGVGFTREPPRFLRPGDTVSVSIDGLGTLENPVLAEEDLL